MNLLTQLHGTYGNNLYLYAVSHGNMVCGEALHLASQAGTGQLVNTYIASQAAMSAHLYDGSTTNFIDFTHSNPKYPFAHPSYGPSTPDIYPDWLAGNSGAVGRRINFNNVNDFALSQDVWDFNQELKPDYDPPNYQYDYHGTISDPAPWNHFGEYPIIGGGWIPIDIVTNVENRYKIVAYAAESRVRALGATQRLIGLQPVDLTTLWPQPDPLNKNYTSHFWHSGQFRGDTVWQWGYWDTLLHHPSRGFNLNNQ
jgi:hypothetical protein